MIKFSKDRLEAFSDGVIAIIITIMVLNIPLPDKFGFNDIIKLLGSILVFFVSFFVVGSQWSKHHHLFDNIKEVSNKIVWRNLLFLFFLSLIPIFTKWVMQNPDEVVPAIGYDIVYLFVNISYLMIWHSMIHENGYEERRKEMENLQPAGKSPWIRFVIMVVIIAAIIVLSFFYPRISQIIFIGIPVVSSLFNLIYDYQDNRKERLLKASNNAALAGNRRNY